MKNRNFGIFAKVFFYTMIILVIVIGTAALFFSSQITTMFNRSQQQQFSDVFEPLMKNVEGKTNDEAAGIAADFHEKNLSFEFCLQTYDGQIVYKTPNFKVLSKNGMSVNEGSAVINNNLSKNQLRAGMISSSSNFSLQIEELPSYKIIYNDFLIRTIITVIVLLCLGGLCALFFARYIAKPIKEVAINTTKMANLEFVSAPVSRRDEIGQMSNDVYRMYEQLKDTIQRLEAEIAREREMEENQRYFFAAASHELKTPIAATGALLEGMLENVIDISEYPENLRECLRMMNEQNKLINEILEIVQLENGKIELKNELFNLKATVLSLLLVFTALAEVKKLNIQIEIEDRLCVQINKNMFGRVLSNIIMNAVQNTPEKGKIKISTENNGNTARLSVINTGTYIPEDVLPKLFDPFYRVDKSRSRSQGSSGLGLTIVKKALDQMNISFAIENTDTGVLFWMDLQL